MTQDYIPKIHNSPMITEVAQVPNADLPPDNSSGSIGTALPVALSIFGVIVFLWFLNTFLQICKPNEILILSGRKRRNQDGQELGYRVIFGGRTMCIPIL